MKDQKKGSGPDPGEILGLSGEFWKSLTLHAGVQLGLFSVIGDESLPGVEVAGRIGGDERGVSTLLDALSAQGLLFKEDGRYANTAASRSFLVKDSPQYIGYMIRHHANLVESWGRLHEAALTGKPVRNRASEGESELEDFIIGMHNSALGVAPRAAREIDLGGRRKLLDLGGGPGTWSVQFTLANPGLRATVFDLPSTQPFAERVINRAGVSERVSFQAGNFNTDELPRGCDAAWLSHIIHGEGPDTCRRLIARTAAALDPGGLLMIHEFILDDDKVSPLFPALFSLNMLAGTPEGRSYSRSELEEMLVEASLRDIRLLPFTGPNESRIIVGLK